MSNRNKKRRAKPKKQSPEAAKREFIGKSILDCYMRNFGDEAMCGTVCPWYRQCVNLQAFYKSQEDAKKSKEDTNE